MRPFKTKDKFIIICIVRKLQKIRKDKKLSQRMVSNDTGINIGRLETAQHNISIITLGKLCNYYDITLEELFKGII